MPLSSWVEVVVGVVLVAVGLVMALARVLPGPAWIWGVRDTDTRAAMPAVRASGTGTMALGGFLLVEAWFFGEPHDPRVVAAAFAVGLCFLGCSIGFNLWSLQLRRRVGTDR